MLSEKVTVWQRWKKRSAPEACFLDATKCIQRCKQFLVGASLIFSPFDKYHHVPNKSLRSRMTRITCFICWNPVGRGDSWWFTTFMIHCFGNRGSLSTGLVTGHSNFTRPPPFCPYVGRAFSSIKMIHPGGQMLLVCTRVTRERHSSSSPWDFLAVMLFSAGTGPKSVTFFAARARRFLLHLVGLMSSHWPAPATEIEPRDGRTYLLALCSSHQLLNLTFYTVHGLCSRWVFLIAHSTQGCRCNRRFQCFGRHKEAGRITVSLSGM